MNASTNATVNLRGDYTLEQDRSTRAADGHAPGSAPISARPRDLPALDPSVP